MKKLGFALLAGLFLFTSSPMMVGTARAEDSICDKAGDWFATMGKSGQEKDQILLQRKMDRAAKKAGDAMNKAGKDLEKAFK